jgi:hypothetical protein
MNKQELVDRVQQMLAKNEIDEALKLLLQFVESKEVRNTSVNLAGKYSHLIDKTSHGIITQAELENAFNNLRLLILKHIDSLEEHHLRKVTSDPLKAMKKEYLLALARIKVLELLLNEQHGLTISEACAISNLKRRRRYIVDSLKELEQLGIVECYYDDQKLKWHKLSQIGRKFITGILVDAK